MVTLAQLHVETNSHTYAYATFQPVRSPVTGAGRLHCSGAWDSLLWIFYKYLGRGVAMRSAVRATVI